LKCNDPVKHRYTERANHDGYCKHCGHSIWANAYHYQTVQLAKLQQESREAYMRYQRELSSILATYRDLI
jgi:hypothetical protein